MSEQGRLWDWLLPGLICLSPMGAIAYYNAAADEEALHLGNHSALPGASELVGNAVEDHPDFARMGWDECFFNYPQLSVQTFREK